LQPLRRRQAVLAVARSNADAANSASCLSASGLAVHGKPFAAFQLRLLNSL